VSLIRGADGLQGTTAIFGFRLAGRIGMASKWEVWGTVAARRAEPARVFASGMFQSMVKGRMKL